MKSLEQELKEKIIEGVKRKGILSDKSLEKLNRRYLSNGFETGDWISLVEDEIRNEGGHHEQ